MKLKILSFVLLTFFLVSLVFHQQLMIHAKIILFITEEFPQIPVKPLGLISLPPFRNRIGLQTKNGSVVGDLFIPVEPGQKGAVIVAMGIKTADKDKPLIIKFADTMARLGYITFWPRLQVLDQGESLPEEPETFIAGFKYIEGLPQTDPQRISFVGFSVGSSTAYVASANPQIRDRVHSLVFFGGYFDIYEYLSALEGKTSWQPQPDAVSHAKALLAAKGVTTSSAELKKYSPKELVADFQSKIFILHDKSDTYVPYTESVRFYEALPKERIAAFHISDLFDHVQPNRPIKFFELVKLYGFLYQVFKAL